MNKTDKFLYGGFAAVALAGIVVLLVSVFSSPKQPAEETAKPPKAEQTTIEAASSLADEPTQSENDYVAFYLDENGNKVWLTQEQRGRLELYPEELKQQEERQEADRIAREKADKEWWEKQTRLDRTIPLPANP